MFVVLLLVNDTVLVPEVNVHDEDAVDPAVRTSLLPRPVIVRVLPELGSVLKLLVAVAAAGALAVNFTPSTVSDELLPTVVELRAPTTPVRVAETPPEVRGWVQSLSIVCFPVFTR